MGSQPGIQFYEQRHKASVKWQVGFAVPADIVRVGGGGGGGEGGDRGDVGNVTVLWRGNLLSTGGCP